MYVQGNAVKRLQEVPRRTDLPDVQERRRLARERNQKSAVPVTPAKQALYRDHDQIFAYTRTLEGEKLLTVCNFSEHVAEMEIPEEFQKNAECLITNLGRKDFGKKVVLKPYEAFVLYKNL